MHDGGMSSPVPVLTVCSVDPVLRGSAVAGMLCDLPGAIAVQHDLDPPGPDGTSMLWRTVADPGGVSERRGVSLGHGCLTCAVREDVLPTLDRLADLRPSAIVLALPVTAEPLPVVRALQHAGPRLRAGAVLTAADARTFAEDLLGDDTLVERGLQLAPDDARTVGETLAHQVEFSDVVLTPHTPDRLALTLLGHLATPGWALDWAPLHDARPAALCRRRRPHDDPRGDLQRVEAPGAPDEEVWTLDLDSPRPVHPARLLDRIEDLGSGRLRGRGHLWIATRPSLACGWDGGGGQLSIGSLGPWTRRPATRLLITGTEDADPHRIAAAFDDCLLTDEEYGAGPSRWQHWDDPLNPWLGDIAETA